MFKYALYLTADNTTLYNNIINSYKQIKEIIFFIETINRHGEFNGTD